MGGISGTRDLGPASSHCICRTKMRADNRIERPYSRSWESRTRGGVKLDAIPNAHDHIAMYKRIGMDFPTNLVGKQPFLCPGSSLPAPLPAHIYLTWRRS